MAGFLEDPVSAGAMSLGLRLLATPGKFGQALGTAGLGAMNDMDRARVLQQAEKNRALQDEMLRMQIEQVKRQQAEREAQRAQQGTDQTLLRTMMENGSQGPAMPPDPRLFMSRGGSLEGVQNLLGLNAALAPKPKKLTAYKPGDQVRDEAGNVAFEVPAAPKEMPEALRALAMIYGEGSPEFMRAAQDYARKLTTHAPAASATVYGTPVQGMDSQGNPVFLQPTKDGSPPNIIPGVRPPKTAGEERTEQERATRDRQAKQMLSVMSDARKILLTGVATNSGIGTAADSAARIVGMTTKGAQDSARLQAMSGWLVANVPRMEGPQSNYDVQNYMTMAGKIGDSTIPIKERLAALGEVEKLQRKYSEINGTPTPGGPVGNKPSVSNW